VQPNSALKRKDTQSKQRLHSNLRHWARFEYQAHLEWLSRIHGNTTVNRNQSRSADESAISGILQFSVPRKECRARHPFSDCRVNLVNIQWFLVVASWSISLLRSILVIQWVHVHHINVFKELFPLLYRTAYIVFVIAKHNDTILPVFQPWVVLYSVPTNSVLYCIKLLTAWLALLDKHWKWGPSNEGCFCNDFRSEDSGKIDFNCCGANCLLPMISIDNFDTDQPVALS